MVIWHVEIDEGAGDMADESARSGLPRAEVRPRLSGGVAPRIACSHTSLLTCRISLVRRRALLTVRHHCRRVELSDYPSEGLALRHVDIRSGGRPRYDRLTWL
ncbi:hypothetical protein GW17_00018630 [Ensete ventricosum]|nr:hypothetical protein GW17_00018630 [Ensete ventricosum]